MKMHEIPVPTQEAIKEALLDQLDEQIESGDLPRSMKIKNVTISNRTISLELFGGMGKVADVAMDQGTYKISHLKLIEEDGEEVE